MSMYSAPLDDLDPPYKAEIERLHRKIERLQRRLAAHHNLANLSEQAIRSSTTGGCQICARALER